MSNLTERSVPRNLEAEASVLGAVLLDNSVIHEVSRTLRPENFYSSSHQAIFKAMLDLYEQNGALDLVMLDDRLAQDGFLEKCGGSAYVASLVDAGSPAHVEYHAKIVRDRAFMRHLVSVCTEVTDTVCESSKAAPELRDWAEHHILDAFRGWESGDAVKIDEILRATMKRLEEMHDRGGGVPGLPTQFYRLDELICGLQPSQLVIIAGRPSMGKTSFAMNVVENIGVIQKQPVLVFSLETSKDQLTLNLLCAHARVQAQQVRRGILPDTSISKLTDAASVIYSAPIFIDDTAGISVLECKAKARQVKERSGLSLVVVDYLQLMSSPGHSRNDSREQEISFISRSLKALGRELDVPVIALAQLNRSVEQREDHRPRLSDLRESGAIEQDADVIMFLHRPWYYDRRDDDEAKKRHAEVIVAKQRNGPTGTIPLVFQYEYMKFENRSDESEPEEDFPEF